MALERQIIEDKFKNEGIPENLVSGVSVETEEDLTNWISNYKGGLPKDFKNFTKEEIEEIAKDPQFKGYKGLQGYLDAFRSKYQKKEDPTPPPTKKEEPKDDKYEALLARFEKLDKEREADKIAAQLAKDKATAKEKISKAGISGFYATSIVAMLGDDFSDENVKKHIDEFQAEETKRGIKTPDKGGKGKGKSDFGFMKEYKHRK